MGIAKHNLSNSLEYGVWSNMKDRCLNVNSKPYKNYGGRGIKVCDEWLSFEVFYNDMGKKMPNMSLDRIDNNGNYCKENCRWATTKEQQNNMRSNVKLTHNGKTQNLSQWADELGIKNVTLYNRIFISKWTVSEALNGFKDKNRVVFKKTKIKIKKVFSDNNKDMIGKVFNIINKNKNAYTVMFNESIKFIPICNAEIVES